MMKNANVGIGEMRDEEGFALVDVGGVPIGRADDLLYWLQQWKLEVERRKAMRISQLSLDMRRAG